MTFLGDEGRDALVVYGILHGKLTLLGPTASVGGFFLGPIYYYFMAPFLFLFNYNPVGPAVMVALFGVATVWLIFKVGSEFFGNKAAIIAALFYTISPVVIAYSRSSWNPNLMPFFTLLTLYFLYKGVKKNSVASFFTSGVLFGISMQLHYIAVFVGFIIIIYIVFIRLLILAESLIEKTKRIVRDGLYVLLGFLVGLSPFITFEVRHEFLNIQSIGKFIFLSGDTGNNSRFFQIISDVFFRLFGRLVTRFPPPEQVSLGASADIALWYYATLLLAFFSVVIFLYEFYKSLYKKNIQCVQFSLLFIWFFIGIILFGFYKKSIYDYYFVFLFPLPFLFVGNALSFIWKKNTLLKIGAILTCSVIIWDNLLGVPFRSPPNRQLAQIEQIAGFVLDKTSGKPYNFAVISGGNSDHGYRYFFKLAGKEPIEIKKNYEDPGRTSVTDQLFVVCESQCSPPGNPAWEISGFGKSEVQESWSVSVVKVYKLIHYTRVDKQENPR